MKKLINDPESVVAESLAGLGAAHPDLLRVFEDPRYVLRADAPRPGKVALVSGGGSGHEPMHTGFVGLGMLDAACPGEVFTSPTPDQVLAATKAANGGAGVVHIVKNYTGDVMNFEMAADLVAEDGISVNQILIDDDVAVEDSLYTAGRRGVGATVLVEKLCGAAAEAGAPLAEVVSLGKRVNEASASMGVALSSCTVPAAAKPTFELADDEMELGIGIHGEPGRERVSLRPAREVVDMLVQPVLDDLALGRGDSVIVFVNGMGATPLSELYLVFNDLRARLGTEGIAISRCLVGPYMTALEMAGCSITLLRSDDQLVSLWDAPVRTAGLRWGA